MRGSPSRKVKARRGIFGTLLAAGNEPSGRRSLAWPAGLMGLLIAALLPAAPSRQSEPAPRVVVLSSLSIPPFERLVHSITERFGGEDSSVFYLDREPSAPSRIAALAPSAILTVGQEALEKALPERDGVPLVFTMVLFPQQILGQPQPGVAGVGMIPSPRSQLQILQRGFARKKVLLFFNPSVTGFLADYFRREASAGIAVEAVPVDSDAALVKRLQSGLGGADAVLLVPDPTLLTEQGLHALITACYGSVVPLVGFSPMYMDMGAAITLSLPEEVTARSAVALVSSAQPEGDVLGGVTYPSSCRVQVSRRAMRRFALPVNESGMLPYGRLEWVK
ncbi:MAG: ABC transporter substrate-binding protein [Acidobacteriota bacterium]